MKKKLRNAAIEIMLFTRIILPGKQKQRYFNVLNPLGYLLLIVLAVFIAPIQACYDVWTGYKELLSEGYAFYKKNRKEKEAKHGTQHSSND